MLVRHCTARVEDRPVPPITRLPWNHLQSVSQRCKLPPNNYAARASFGQLVLSVLLVLSVQLTRATGAPGPETAILRSGFVILGNGRGSWGMGGVILRNRRIWGGASHRPVPIARAAPIAPEKSPTLPEALLQ